MKTPTIEIMEGVGERTRERKGWRRDGRNVDEVFE
jgi:hypothetical protein